MDWWVLTQAIHDLLQCENPRWSPIQDLLGESHGLIINCRGQFVRLVKPHELVRQLQVHSIGHLVLQLVELRHHLGADRRGHGVLMWWCWFVCTHMMLSPLALSQFRPGQVPGPRFAECGTPNADEGMGDRAGLYVCVERWYISSIFFSLEPKLLQLHRLDTIDINSLSIVSVF
jgi:hypothetical protein